MPNHYHVKQLWLGANKWNKWRADNPDIIPNLNEADLRKADLSTVDLSEAGLVKAKLCGANLSEAILYEANLFGADLSKANLDKADLHEANLTLATLSGATLSEANLISADLIGANLNDAKLIRAKLQKANLSFKDYLEDDLNKADLRKSTHALRTNLNGANLSGADLNEADLSGATLIAAILSWADLNNANLTWANLTKADLSKATFNQANLSMAILNKANLSWADFSRATLSEADLSQASLRKANLSKADLHSANLSEADLREANLSMARLINANFDRAILKDARLWETQRAGWSIKGVVCDSIYWDKEGVEKISYSQNEFEKLFAEKTKIRLFYKDGIQPLEIVTLPALIEHLEKSHPGSRLRLLGITEDSGGAVVELAIEDGTNQSPRQLKQLKVEMELAAKRAIELERNFLAEEKHRLRLEGEVKQLNSFVDKLILRPNISIQGDYMGDTYNVGQAGAVGTKAHAHDMTFTQIGNQLEKSIDMFELAKQLAELRRAISATEDSSPQTALALGKVAEAEIAVDQKNSAKVVEALKAAGQWTLDFAKEIGKEVAAEAIKHSMGMS